MFEKTKKHFKENKKVYFACAGTAVITAVGTVLVLNRTAFINNRQLQILTYRSKQTMEVYIEALGDPGNIIQDMTTGIVYASQGQAARELGLQKSDISRHLHGGTEHVRGHVFEKLGKAAVAE